jgi:hypothetical protein
MEIQHEVRPRQKTFTVAKTVHLTLRGGNSISERRTADNLNRGVESSGGEGTFRQEMGGGAVRSSWRVESSKTLVRTSSWPQHNQTIRVTLDSDTSCQASISYQLKPGFTEYRMRSISMGVPIFQSQVAAEQISCRVSG